MKAKQVRILLIESSDGSATYIHHYVKNRLAPLPERVGFMCSACGIVYPDLDKAQKCCNK